MARPLRIEYPGAVYHITSRGNARNRIYRDDPDREMFLSILSAVVKRYSWFCHSYCLMNNHYHLVIETPDANLSIGMRQLNGIYTQKYNRRHHKTGHIFQGRFKAILVQKENYLLEVCRYVVLNPVRAGVVKKPGDWKWSSYLAAEKPGEEATPLTTDWILGLFSSKKALARKKYRVFVQEGINRGAPWSELRGQALLGGEGFVEKFRDLLEDKKKIKEIPRLQRYVSRPGLDKIFIGQMGKSQRDTSMHAAHMGYGYTLKDIADYLGIHYTTVSKAVAKVEGKKI
jgi:putative transposase